MHFFLRSLTLLFDTILKIRNATTIRGDTKNMADGNNNAGNGNNGNDNNNGAGAGAGDQNNNGQGNGGAGGEGGQGNGGQGNGSDNIQIPKSRFDEESKKRQDAEAELKKYKDAEAKRIEDERIKKGEHEKLYNEEKAKREAAEKRLTDTAKTNALQIAAIKAGTVDVDAVIALSKLDDIKVSEDGAVDSASVDAIIKKLQTDKAYLFGKKADDANIGDGGGGAGDGDGSAGKTFKRSQLSDPKFYADNRQAILKAQAEGKIIDDINPS